MSDAPLLQLVGVTKRFESPVNSNALTVLNDVSLEVGSGQSLAIVGPSGSGKSTLLHIIGTLDRPSSGKVMLEGQDAAEWNERQLAEARTRHIGFVFQAHYLLPQCTVIENVLVPTLADGATGSGPQAEERARRLLGRVGLAERMFHRPSQLSGGESQRVAVVRALINQPRLLLADEPTGALDHASAQELGALLFDLNREEGVTLMLVTHSLELARRAGRVLELRDARLSPQARREPVA